MAGSASQNTVPKLYLSVVDDVISNIREAFLDDGVDESVLEELKTLWLGKLKASKALESPPIAKSEVAATQEYIQQIHQQQQHHHHHHHHHHQQPQQPTLIQPQFQSNSSVGNASHTIHPVHVPIQITGSRDLTNPAAAATMALPAGMFQQQLLSQGLTLQPTSTGQLIAVRTLPGGATVQGAGAAGGTQLQVMQPTLTMANTQRTFTQTGAQGGHILQLDGSSDSICNQSPDNNESCDIRSTNKSHCRRAKEVIIQLDGAGDTSSEEDDEDEGNEEEVEGDEAEGVVEEPLNSEDDISEADPSELFDTENVVVCQYDKINRNKNRWKFQLKDGIMNLNGRDYVFQRATGDAEW